MSDQLRFVRDTVALESGFVGNMAQTLRNVFPTVTREFHEFVKNMGFVDSAPVSFSGDKSKFEKVLQQKSFVNIAPILVTVPEGLAVPYLEYLEQLEPAVEYASSVMIQVLVPYSMYLANIVTNKDAKLSSVEFGKQHTRWEQSRNNFNTKLGSCFAPGSMRSEVPYNKAVRRNADWKEVFEKIEVISRKINSVKRTEIKQTVDSCVHMIDTIQRMIDRNELDGVTPQVSRGLAEGAYQVAREVEFFSLVYYRCLAVVGSVENTVKRINKIRI